MRTLTSHIGLLAALSVVVVLASSGCTIQDYSDGFRIGTINKFSLKGYTYKTWEGEMALGGVRASTDKEGSTTYSPNVWEFSVDGQAAHHENTEQLVLALTKAAESGARVKITYKQDLCFCPTRGSTNYFVQRVEEVGR